MIACTCINFHTRAFKIRNLQNLLEIKISPKNKRLEAHKPRRSHEKPVQINKNIC